MSVSGAVVVCNLFVQRCFLHVSQTICCLTKTFCHSNFTKLCFWSCKLSLMHRNKNIWQVYLIMILVIIIPLSVFVWFFIYLYDFIYILLFMIFSLNFFLILDFSCPSRCSNSSFGVSIANGCCAGNWHVACHWSRTTWVRQSQCIAWCRGLNLSC